LNIKLELNTAFVCPLSVGLGFSEARPAALSVRDRQLTTAPWYEDFPAMEAAKPNIIVICGPTGVGKTAMGIELAKMFPGEIIGADSMQIYRYMDIGTAKPTAAEQAAVNHHMIDIIDPDESFDAARFALMAGDRVKDLHIRNRIAYVVGGTGLYIKALLHGLFQTQRPASEVRERLRQEAAVDGSGSLHRRLARCDPDAARRIHANDSYRIIRALETYEASGEALSQQQRRHGFEPTPFRTLKIALNLDRTQLYERIDRRVERMFGDGLLDEVRQLQARGYAADLKSMQAIGYRHTLAYLGGKLDWAETLRTFKRDTRRYAKRQLTWFRADAEIIWSPPRLTTSIVEIVGKFVAGTRTVRSY